MKLDREKVITTLRIKRNTLEMENREALAKARQEMIRDQEEYLAEARASVVECQDRLKKAKAGLMEPCLYKTGISDRNTKIEGIDRFLALAEMMTDDTIEVKSLGDLRSLL